MTENNKLNGFDKVNALNEGPFDNPTGAAGGGAGLFNASAFGGAGMGGGLATQNIDRTQYNNITAGQGTVGGTEAFHTDVARYMDYINGQGPYGQAGRDHSFALASLAVVNPLAAGAILGTMGAGAAIYGIATSAYVRANQTKRRLKHIYKGVIGDGYKSDNMFYGFFGKFGSKKKSDYGIGVKQFKTLLYKDIDAILAALSKHGLATNQLRGKPASFFKKKSSQISNMLTRSYLYAYIPTPEAERIKGDYNSIMQDSGVRRSMYGKNASTSFDELIKKTLNQNENAPLYSREEKYLNQVKGMGDNFLKAYETKMAHALKRGGNRATACYDKLKGMWETMMKEINIVFDKAIDEVMASSKYRKLKENIDALYRIKNQKLTVDDIASSIQPGDIYVWKKSKNPIFLIVGDVDFDNDRAECYVANTNIPTGTPLSGYITFDDLSDANLYYKMVEIAASELQEGQIYTMNLTPDSQVYYIFLARIVEIAGKKYAMYVYCNNGMAYTPGGAGTFQMMRYEKFEGSVINNVVVPRPPHANNEAEVFDIPYSDDYVLFEADGNEGDGEKENRGDEGSEGDGDAEKDNKEPKDEEKDKEGDSDKEDTEDDTKEEESKGFDMATVEKELPKYAFVNEGTYTLNSVDGQPVVMTGKPLGGKVEVKDAAYGTVEIAKWNEFGAVEEPELETDENPTGDLFDGENTAVLEPAYPMTYKDFYLIYMNPKYRPLFEPILKKYEKDLNKYCIIYDEKGVKPVGYGVPEGEEGNGDSLAFEKNFKVYLEQIIPQAMFEEKNPNEGKSEKENANESAKYVFDNSIYTPVMRMNALFEKNDNNTKVNTEVGGDSTNTANAMGDAGDVKNGAGVQVVGSGNTVIYQTVVAAADKQAEAAKKRKTVSKRTRKQGTNKDDGKKGNEGEDKNVIEVKPLDPNNIPEIITKVCKEIRDRVSKYCKAFENGYKATLLNQKGSVFTCKKDVLDEAIQKNVDDIIDVKNEKVGGEKSLQKRYICPEGRVVIELSDINEESKNKIFKTDEHVITMKSKAELYNKLDFKPAELNNADSVIERREQLSEMKRETTYEVDKTEFEKIISENDGKVSDAANETAIAYYNAFERLFEEGEEGGGDDEQRDTIRIYVKSFNDDGTITVITSTKKEVTMKDAAYKNLKKTVFDASSIVKGKEYIIDKDYYANVIGAYVSNRNEVDATHPICSVEDNNADKSEITLKFGDTATKPIAYLYIDTDSFTEYTESENLKELKDDTYFEVSQKDFDNYLKSFTDKATDEKMEDFKEANEGYVVIYVKSHKKDVLTFVYKAEEGLKSFTMYESQVNDNIKWIPYKDTTVGEKVEFENLATDTFYKISLNDYEKLQKEFSETDKEGVVNIHASESYLISKRIRALYEDANDNYVTVYLKIGKGTESKKDFRNHGEETTSDVMVYTLYIENGNKFELSEEDWKKISEGEYTFYETGAKFNVPEEDKGEDTVDAETVDEQPLADYSIVKTLQDYLVKIGPEGFAKAYEREDVKNYMANLQTVFGDDYKEVLKVYNPEDAKSVYSTMNYLLNSFAPTMNPEEGKKYKVIYKSNGETKSIEGTYSGEDKEKGVYIFKLEDDKEVRIPKEAADNGGCVLSKLNEAAFRIDMVALSKHKLYGTPLNEAIIMNFDAQYAGKVLEFFSGLYKLLSAEPQQPQNPQQPQDASTPNGNQPQAQPQNPQQGGEQQKPQAPQQPAQQQGVPDGFKEVERGTTPGGAPTITWQNVNAGAVEKYGLSAIFDSLNEDEGDPIPNAMLKNAVDASLDTLDKKGKHELARTWAEKIKEGAAAGKTVLVALICALTMIAICPNEMSAKEIKVVKDTPAVVKPGPETDREIARRTLARNLVKLGFDSDVLKLIGLGESPNMQNAISKALNQYRIRYGNNEYDYSVCQYKTQDGTLMYMAMVYPTKPLKEREMEIYNSTVRNHNKWK